MVKYRYNPNAVTAAETVHKAAEELVAAATTELQNRTDEATAAASDNKAAADAAVAEAALAAAAAKLKTVTDKAAPKDTADIVLSEPIAIKVK